jgi:hypothetical protein
MSSRRSNIILMSKKPKELTGEKLTDEARKAGERISDFSGMKIIKKPPRKPDE